MRAKPLAKGRLLRFCYFMKTFLEKKGALKTGVAEDWGQTCLLAFLSEFPTAAWYFCKNLSPRPLDCRSSRFPGLRKELFSVGMWFVTCDLCRQKQIRQKLTKASMSASARHAAEKLKSCGMHSTPARPVPCSFSQKLYLQSDMVSDHQFCRQVTIL